MTGVPLAEDTAVLELGLNGKISEAVTVGVSYVGQFGDGSQDQGLRGDLSWAF